MASSGFKDSNKVEKSIQNASYLFFFLVVKIKKKKKNQLYNLGEVPRRRLLTKRPLNRPLHKAIRQEFI